MKPETMSQEKPQPDISVTMDWIEFTRMLMFLQKGLIKHPPADIHERAELEGIVCKLGDITDRHLVEMAARDRGLMNRIGIQRHLDKREINELKASCLTSISD